MQHTLDDQVPVAVTMDDGSVAFLTFMRRGGSPTLPFGARWEDGTGKTGIWLREPTDANLFAELSKAFPAVDQLGLPKPQPVSYQVISRDAIPTDRTYRNAMRRDGGTIIHDLPHARRIHMERVRYFRTEQLGALDRDWMKATGQGKTQEADAIEAQRQALRDLPQVMNVESAQTIEDLKALWPEGLARP